MIGLLSISIFMVLSCSVFQPKYLPKEYVDNLKTSKKSGIIACVSDRNLDRTFEYGENAFVSDTTHEWVQAGVNPKRVLYYMLRESTGYMFQECKDPNIYDIQIIPDITSARIERLNSSRKRTGDQNEEIYGKEYSANIGLNIKVIDKERNDILNIKKTVGSRAWGYGRVPPTCVSSNCWDWANEASIENGSTNAVVKAIYDVLPTINDQISGHDSVMQLEKSTPKRIDKK